MLLLTARRLNEGSSLDYETACSGMLNGAQMSMPEAKRDGWWCFELKRLACWFGVGMHTNNQPASTRDGIAKIWIRYISIRDNPPIGT